MVHEIFQIKMRTILPRRPDDKPIDKRLPRVVLLRLGMPFAPYFKVESEVATMMFAHDKGVPVPQVYFFDSSGKNCLGLDCMIVERLEEEPLTGWHRNVFQDNPERADSAAINALEVATQEVRRLWDHPFKHIGSLFYDWERHEFYIGPCVEGLFFQAAYLLGYEDGEHEWGPFDNVFDYIEAECLAKAAKRWERKRATCWELTGKDFVFEDIELPLDGSELDGKADPEVDKFKQCHDQAKTILRQSKLIANEVLPAVRQVFEAWAFKQLQTWKTGACCSDPHCSKAWASLAALQKHRAALQPRLWHPDLHLRNILYDPRNAKITGIIDWEQVVIKPAALSLGVAKGAFNLGARIKPGSDAALFAGFSMLHPHFAETDFGDPHTERNPDLPEACRRRMGRLHPQHAPPPGVSIGCAVMLRGLLAWGADVGRWKYGLDDEMRLWQAVGRFDSWTEELYERIAEELSEEGPLVDEGQIAEEDPMNGNDLAEEGQESPMET